jgi:hypothetical protein
MNRCHSYTLFSGQAPGGDENVLSGLMKDAGEIDNRPAIVDVPVGQGRVLLFNTNPCYRWQNLGEFACCSTRS